MSNIKLEAMDTREEIEKLLTEEYGAYYDKIVDKLLDLYNVIECPTCKNDGREIRYDIGTYPCATCGGKGFR